MGDSFRPLPRSKAEAGLGPMVALQASVPNCQHHNQCYKTNHALLHS